MILVRNDQQASHEPTPSRSGSSQHLVRLLVLAPIAALVFAMIQAARHGQVEASISAYHGGPFRDVFVAGLVGTSVALIAYWGVTPLEDYAFNMAGLYAVFVALVPYNVAEDLLKADANPELGTRAVVVQIMWSFLIAVLIFAMADFFKGTWSPGWLLKRNSSQDTTRGERRAALWCRIIGMLSFAAFVIYIVNAVRNLLDPNTTFAGMHFPAALLLFAHLGIVVLGQSLNLMPQDEPPPIQLRIFYVVIVVAMAVAAALAFWASGNNWAPPNWVLLLELTEAGLFALFWVAELVRFWTVRDSSGRGVEPAAEPAHEVEGGETA